MASSWHLLPLSTQVDHAAPFLIRYDVGPQAYTVHITNLIHIWVEELGRKLIIRRALDDDASIDPSEGSNQFRLLLQNIKNSLAGQPGTSLKLLTPPNTEATSLELEVIATLPTPLLPLIWHIHLSRAPQALISTELFLPCLASISIVRSEATSLLALIKDKDNVIGKLTDRLEATGIELSNVFLSAASTKRSKASVRQSIVKSVKGLEKFDEDKWRRSRPNAQEQDLQTICREVFGAKAPVLLDPHLSADVVPHNSVRGSDDSNVADSETQFPGLLIEHGSTDDEFQRQTTPSRDGKSMSGRYHPTHVSPLANPGGSRILPGVSRGSVSDASDEDLDVLVPKIASSVAIESLQNRVGKKLGMLGGKKTQPLFREADAELTLPQRPQRISSPTLKRSLQAGAIPSPLSVSPRKKFGVIGGAGVEPETVKGTTERKASVPPSQGQGPEHSDSLALATAIGGGRGALGRLESPPPPRETSRERADRKRVELKRELEEKSRIAPKKQRKF